jgi:histidyl-tRNA synthetase
LNWVFENDMVNFDQQLEERYLILNFPETLEKVLPVSGVLANEGKIVSIYPEPDKLKKQFAYADKSGFTHVVICGEEELAQ